MKFRKKPVVIEAVQFDPNVRPYPSGVCEGGFGYDANGERFSYPKFWIKTLEGFHEVTPGDWIITGVKGERYPCKPDIFAATYDAVP